MIDPPRSTPPTWQIVVAFSILYVVWGTTYLAIQIGVLDQHLPPLLFGGTRIGTSGLILLSFQLARGRALRFSMKDAVGIALGSTLLFVAGNGLISIALQTVQSGESAVLAATATLWIAIFSMAFTGGDRLRPLGWLGIVIGLFGVVVLQLPKLREQGVGFASQIGPWLNLASAACWGVGTVVLRQMPIRIPRLSSAGWQMALGGAVMIALGLRRGEVPPERITAGIVGVFLYLLIFGSLIAFIAFHWLLEHVPAPKVGTYAYFNPLVAVILGTMFHREPISWALVAGMLLILAGVFMVRGGDRSAQAKLTATPNGAPRPEVCSAAAVPVAARVGEGKLRSLG